MYLSKRERKVQINANLFAITIYLFSVHLPQKSYGITSACIFTISPAPQWGTGSLFMFFNYLYLVHISTNRTFIYVISNLKVESNSLFRPGLFWITGEKMEGVVASWSLRSSPDRAVRVRGVLGETDVLLSQCFSPPRCIIKWVPANVMVGVNFFLLAMPAFLLSAIIMGDNCPSENKLAIPLPRTNYYKNSFSYRGAVLWNSLPSAARQATSLTNFR